MRRPSSPSRSVCSPGRWHLLCPHSVPPSVSGRRPPGGARVCPRVCMCACCRGVEDDEKDIPFRNSGTCPAAAAMRGRGAAHDAQLLTGPGDSAAVCGLDRTDASGCRPVAGRRCCTLPPPFSSAQLERRTPQQPQRALSLSSLQVPLCCGHVPRARLLLRSVLPQCVRDHSRLGVSCCSGARAGLTQLVPPDGRASVRECDSDDMGIRARRDGLLFLHPGAVVGMIICTKNRLKTGCARLAPTRTVCVRGLPQRSAASRLPA